MVHRRMSPERAARWRASLIRPKGRDERDRRIELLTSDWKSDVLPVN